jgi:hypothetical protein
VRAARALANEGSRSGLRHAHDTTLHSGTDTGQPSGNYATGQRLRATVLFRNAAKRCISRP